MTPGWAAVEAWLATATNPVEVLPANETRAAKVLSLIGVTTNSPMGAIAAQSGGLVIDGWLRVLGGGGPRMDGDQARWNGLGDEPLAPRLQGAFVVALDLLGGVFALFAATRKVAYFAPDTLRWEPLALGYGEFVHAMLHSNLDEFFRGLRWPDWRAETATLGLNDGIMVYPFLWTKESREAPPSRSVVPMRQLVGAAFDMARQLGS
jgi:hypothetical protein